MSRPQTLQDSRRPKADALLSFEIENELARLRLAEFGTNRSAR